ncbi:hypothetical protein [Streptomyces acidicola]|uniref:hypothetical protein n=1 Tax=Streptomyces acidicola TaxID=2596892 RepID=UPI00342FC6C2
MPAQDLQQGCCVPQLRERVGQEPQYRAAGLPLVLPDAAYPLQVGSTVDRATSTAKGLLRRSHAVLRPARRAVWDCVSLLRIDATPTTGRRTICGADACELFAALPGCALFFCECVNMWPLKDFGRITSPRSTV